MAIRETVAVVRDGVRLFIRTNGLSNAAALSFYAFFSLIPLMIFITAAAGFVLGTRAGLIDKVIIIVKDSLPYISDRIIGDIKGLARSWKTFGWLGFITLFLSAELVLDSAATALSAIFDTEKRFSFFRRKVVNLLVLLLAIGGTLVSIAMTAAALVLKKVKIYLFGIDIAYWVIQSLTFQFLLPFVLTVVLVSIVYWILSGPNMDWQYSFYGSILFSSLWELAKHLFAWYVYNFSSYNKVYGSLGALMVLLLWILYSSNIFLFSASIAKAAYDHARRPSPGRRARPLAGDGWRGKIDINHTK